METEGRVLNGLDEFMLRLGHLSVLLRAANDAGGSWRHIYKAASTQLSAEVQITSESNEEVADYLLQKELCSAGNQSKLGTEETYRYPNLSVVTLPDGRKNVQSTASEVPRITWQDRNLAADGVPSRVGSISASGKYGSRTGLFHVCDWAQFLGLLSSTGQLSANARLIVDYSTTTPSELWNPYLIGDEMLVYAFEYFLKDFDVFARFAPKLVTSKSRLTKSVCRELFVESLREVAKDSEQSQKVAPRDRFELMQQLRDLEKAARKSNKRIEETSTAWHRTASRVETYVDLGLLVKDKHSPKDKYKYVYYPTERMNSAVSSLSTASDAEEWVFEKAATTVFGEQDLLKPTEQDFLGDLARVVRKLSMPTGLLPIPCLALGVVCIQRARGPFMSLGEARRMLEQLPTTNPDIARLARGRSGTRAEFISVNLQRLSGIQLPQ